MGEIDSRERRENDEEKGEGIEGNELGLLGLTNFQVSQMKKNAKWRDGEIITAFFHKVPQHSTLA